MHELLGAYALDAVDADERGAFEAHLATCPACADELDELRAMLADLAESTAVAPPPALRARVLQGVTPSGTEGSPAPVPPGTPPPALPDNVRALRPAPGPSRRLLLAAAAAAVVAGGGGTAWWRARSTTPSTPADRVLAAADAVRVSAPVRGGGTATVTRSASLRRAVLQVSGAPALASGRTYQAWYAVPAGFAAAGLVPQGEAVTVLLEGDATLASGVGLTDEPAGGSPQPTTEPLALIALSA